MKNLHQRFTTGLLAFLVTLGGCPTALAAEAGDAWQEAAQTASDWLDAQTQPGRTLDQDSIAADWKFDQAYTSGSIAQGDLIIEDQSGNNNDLKMQVYNNGNQEQYISFNDSSMTGTGGSMVLNGDNDSKTGVDFITVDGAAINKETFPDGYTMEFIYYFPEDWTAADQWMSLIGRQGSNGGNPEGEQGTMYTSISNCKEIQFITGNAAGNHTMSSAAWSVSMDKGGVWYHIAVVSDGQEIATYVNGCEAFRDYVSSDMDGMYADPADAASAWAPPGGTAWTSSSKAACRRSVSPKQRWRNRIGLSPTLRTMWKTSAATRTISSGTRTTITSSSSPIPRTWWNSAPM